MPRPERQLDPGDGPVAEFACALRRARNEARATYRELSERTHFSHAHLVRAARGDVLPSWPVTLAYLRGCGVTSEEELGAWEQFWAATEAVAARPTRSGPRKMGRKTERGPASISTMAEFGKYLQNLSSRQARFTLRELQDQTGIGRSTINGWFQGQRLPSVPLLRRFAQAMGAGRGEIEQLQAARLRLARGNARGTELGRTLAAVLRTEQDTTISEAVRDVSLALARAEGHRVERLAKKPDGQGSNPEIRRASRVAYELERFNATLTLQAQAALNDFVHSEDDDPGLREERIKEMGRAGFQQAQLRRIAELVRSTDELHAQHAQRSESAI